MRIIAYVKIQNTNLYQIVLEQMHARCSVHVDCSKQILLYKKIHGTGAALTLGLKRTSCQNLVKNPL